MDKQAELTKMDSEDLTQEIRRLCEDARRSAADVAAINPNRGGFGWAKNGGSAPPPDPLVEELWREKASASQARAQALASLAAQATRDGRLTEVRGALAEEFKKPGLLPCDRTARAIAHSLVEMARENPDSAGLAAQEWTADEAFWSSMREAGFGASTRGVWGVRAQADMRQGEARFSWGEPLASLLSMGAQNETLAEGSIALAGRVAGWIERVDPAAWEELARGAKGLAETALKNPDGLKSALDQLPLSYWLSLREWTWSDREEPSGAALDEVILRASLERVEEPEAAERLSKHLWMMLDKEGLTRLEALRDAEALAHLGKWWGGPSPEVCLASRNAWAKRLLTPAGAWAKPAFEAAGLSASSEEGERGAAWAREGYEQTALQALRSAYASLQAGWLGGGAASPKSKKPTRGL